MLESAKDFGRYVFTYSLDLDKQSQGLSKRLMVARNWGKIEIMHSMTGCL